MGKALNQQPVFDTPTQECVSIRYSPVVIIETNKLRVPSGPCITAKLAAIRGWRPATPNWHRSTE